MAAVTFVNILLSFQLLLLLLFATIGKAQDSSCSRTYDSSWGTITSPNYPSNYNSNANCVYVVTATVPSSITFAIRVLALETAERCTFDWIEISCNSTYYSSVPVRYCGTGSNPSPLVFLSCNRTVIRFRSDGSVTSSGFLIDYNVDPGCDENCTLNSTGCPVDCVLTPPSQYQYQYCFCRMPLSTVTTPSSLICPPGCFYEYDFYGQRSCRCPMQSVTTEADCPYRCTRRTDRYGSVACDCGVTTDAGGTTPCPYGCYYDRDFWGYRFCNCRAVSSAQPPIWCSTGCTSALDAYGRRYCRCQTTSRPTGNRCSRPCYLRHDRYPEYCYCPPTTTSSTSVCDRTVVDSFGIIASPNYPSQYPSLRDCYQYISIPGAVSSMKIQILDLDLYYDHLSTSRCYDDYIEITGCDNNITTFCSFFTLKSSTLEFRCRGYSAQATIKFNPVYTSYNRVYRGFKMAYSVRYYSSSNCSDSGIYLTEGSTGVITSPNYPRSFTDHTQCTNYLYTDQQALSIQIQFEHLQLESSSTCRDVFLVLSCEDKDDYYRINRTICGYVVPPGMTFNCRTLKIHFRADHFSYGLSTRSFSLRYYVTKAMDQTTYSLAATNPGGLNTNALGLSLGLGGGGLLLVILVVLIIVITVSYRRQVARMEQRHLQELTVLCRNMRENGSGGAPADVTFSRGGSALHSRENARAHTHLVDTPDFAQPVQTLYLRCLGSAQFVVAKLKWLCVCLISCFFVRSRYIYLFVLLSLRAILNTQLT